MQVISLPIAKIGIDAGMCNVGVGIKYVNNKYDCFTISNVGESIIGILEAIKLHFTGMRTRQLLFEKNTGMSSTNMIIIGAVASSLRELPESIEYVSPVILKEGICGHKGADKQEMLIATKKYAKLNKHLDHHAADAVGLCLLDEELFTRLC